jgi:hypothetical protein
VYAEARTIYRAVMTDFFFKFWCLEVPSDSRIQQVPGCVYNSTQYFFFFIEILGNLANMKNSSGYHDTELSSVNI